MKSRTPLTPDQLFDYRIIAALKDYHGEGYKPIKSGVGLFNSHEKLTTQQVIQAAAALVAALNFGGGSDLYPILQAVLLDKDKRKEIQDLLKSWMPPSKAFV